MRVVLVLALGSVGGSVMGIVGVVGRVLWA